MRKLSKAQVRVLREVAAGDVTLVYAGDNAHSYRMRDAVGKDGKKVNRQYDVLVTRKLIAQGGGEVSQYAPRPVGVTQAGYDLLCLLGLAGTLIAAAVQHGTGDSWMVRVENDTLRPCVLYKNGKVHDRYYQLDSVWAVFRSYCPLPD